MTPTDLLTFDRVGSVHIVTITTGELTSTLAEELSTRLLALLNESSSKSFVIDLSQVQFMQSACIGSLVQFVKWLAHEDGRVVIAGVQENVRFLFRVTKLDSVFPLCADVPAALALIGRRA